MSWTLIRQAYGNWELEDTFPSKRKALLHAAFYEDDGNPVCRRSGTYYEYKSWGIVRTDNLKRHGYDEDLK